MEVGASPLPPHPQELQNRPQSRKAPPRSCLRMVVYHDYVAFGEVKDGSEGEDGDVDDFY